MCASHFYMQQQPIPSNFTCAALDCVLSISIWLHSKLKSVERLLFYYYIYFFINLLLQLSDAPRISHPYIVLMIKMPMRIYGVKIYSSSDTRIHAIYAYQRLRACQSMWWRRSSEYKKIYKYICKYVACLVYIMHALFV